MPLARGKAGLAAAYRTARHSLVARLILLAVMAVMATTIAAGVPAFWLIRTKLEQQAWDHVISGGRVTLALLEAEQLRVANMAVLASQRPTLQRLLRDQDPDALASFVEDLRASASLDFLVARDAEGRLITGDGSMLACEAASPEAEYCVLNGSPPRLALVAAEPVIDSITGSLLGHVTAAVLLNGDFVERLSARTGLEQSVIIGGARVATSLPEELPAPDGEAIALAAPYRPATTELKAEGSRYYTALVPLRDGAGRDVATFEIALPVRQLVAAENQAVLTLVLSTLLVIAVGSAVSVYYAGRLTAPLGRLTEAAHNLSQGDFVTPVPVSDSLHEIATLARALEDSRVNTRHALDDLSQAKAWSDTLIQSIAEGIVTVDTQGRVAFFSQGAERITGWSAEEVLGQPLDDVFRLSTPDGGFTRHTPPPGGRRQVGVLTRTGKPITLAVTTAQLRPPFSAGTQTAFVLRDITEEEAIQHLRSYFLANISHEFRTPLSALKASVEVLADEIGSLSRAEIGELLRSIIRSVTGLQTLVDNLLESASIEAGRFNVRRCQTRMREVVDEAVQMTRPLLDRRQQTLTVSDVTAIPYMYVDPMRMTQVLVNLLSNASKYSPVDSAIVITLDQVGMAYLRVSVADEGPGIPPSERAHLFSRFVRLAARDGTQYGIGLGLSVVKAIVEEHGGQVGVDERPGGGSVFWFTMPITGDDG
jgi:PAS domain S-box-containing protein